MKWNFRSIERGDNSFCRIYHCKGIDITLLEENLRTCGYDPEPIETIINAVLATLANERI